MYFKLRLKTVAHYGGGLASAGDRDAAEARDVASGAPHLQTPSPRPTTRRCHLRVEEGVDGPGPGPWACKSVRDVVGPVYYDQFLTNSQL